jgi:hypothetical protein
MSELPHFSVAYGFAADLRVLRRMLLSFVCTPRKSYG